MKVLETENTALKRLATAVDAYFRYPPDHDLQDVLTEMKNALDEYEMLSGKSQKLKLIRFPGEPKIT